jgi:hypothetical protein
MAGYNRVDPFSPLDTTGNGGWQRTDPSPGTYFDSPLPYNQPWEPYHGDIGSPEFEMHDTPRPGVQSNQQSQRSVDSRYSTSSTLFPSKQDPNGEINIISMRIASLILRRYRKPVLSRRPCKSTRHQLQRQRCPLQRSSSATVQDDIARHINEVVCHSGSMCCIWRLNFGVEEERGTGRNTEEIVQCRYHGY